MQEAGGGEAGKVWLVRGSLCQVNSFDTVSKTLGYYCAGEIKSGLFQ